MKIIVLDDDPTGIQTVHNVPVYTDWDLTSISAGFNEPGDMFFVLTNSRSFSEEKTRKIHCEIAFNVEEISQKNGEDYLIISRSDSTLRGHYPLETDVLREEIEQISNKKFDGEIFIPFFKEGGRFTIDNIHYVREKEQLIPAAETEFAQDKTFGYKNSDLRLYIEEKTSGRAKANEITVISLDSIRKKEKDIIANQLLNVSGYRRVIVNATNYNELDFFCEVLHFVIKSGKRFMYRTAASFVRSFARISPKPYLKREDLLGVISEGKGLIMVGSHTTKTTAQLNHVKEIPNLCFIEFKTDTVLAKRIHEEAQRVAKECDIAVANGQTAVVYTSRNLLEVDNDSPEQALARSVEISEAFQSVVSTIKCRPSYIIAKGGITSSDIGVKALGVKRALAAGQVAPGIPVWKTGEESLFPGIPYIIFPGNVGDEYALKNITAELEGVNLQDKL